VQLPGVYWPCNWLSLKDMAYTKRVVCLANSRKMSGRCMAGKEYSQSDGFGVWVRPVSDRATQEVSEEERRYSNGDDPKLLDIVDIPMIEAMPHAHQIENHLIDSQQHWVKRGELDWNGIGPAIEKFGAALWVDGYSSYNGLNDRIPEDQIANIGGSLTLVEPDKLVISVAPEFNQKRKVRAHLSFGNQAYILMVTDPVIEKQYLAGEDGDFEISAARVCISVGEPYQKFCYKLVAAVIKP
jgi:hypothetical protein